MGELALRQPTTVEQFDAYEAEALRAIDAATTPDEMERVLGIIKTVEEAARASDKTGELERRWRALHLRAEARKGELLGPAKHGGDRRSNQVSPANLKPADRVAGHEARKVASVARDKPEVFEEYLETATEPTRAGLLRAADEAPKPKATRKANSRRPPLPDAAAMAGWDIRKAVERIERIVVDDRLSVHRPAVVKSLRPHLLYVVETCTALIEQLEEK